ncbi:MAG: type II secretion system minor pseudopilin GspJ [Asticcacaulis sp.]
MIRIHRHRRRQRVAHRAGFTLIELLVSLAIFGLIAAAGVTVVAFTVNNHTALKARSAALGEVQTARELLKRDLLQAVARPTRSGSGAQTGQSFIGQQPGQTVVMAFVRAGVINPSETARPALQYVEYAVVADRLERRVRPMLDGAPVSAPVVLMRGITRAELEFQGRDGWTPVFLGQGSMPLPFAVRVRLETRTFGPLDQVFLVPGQVTQ